MVQFSITTPLRLEQIGREFVRPLVEFLAAANQGLLVWAREAMGRHSPETVTGIHWGFGRGRKLLAKPRFWRRQTWGMGESLTMDKSRKLWLS
ncbi:MAG TPA: hypothetical protein HPQ00_08655 [Magnetococcales bacterium]|nr:hypothetical protein [Magnetococcales bacterium]